MSDSRDSSHDELDRPVSGDSGAVTLEWLGIAAVVVVFLGGFISAAPGLGQTATDRFRCFVEAVTAGAGSADGGCGDVGEQKNDDGGGPVGQDAEDPRTPLERATAGDYIAIGDSFSSGEGAGEYGDSDCHRSANGYPVVIGGDYDFVGDVINVTCSGALIGNVNGDTGQHGEDPQIAAITDDASLITVGISGNDTGWTDVVTSCATDGQMGGDLCNSTEAVRARMDATLEDFDDLLGEITTTAEDARVVALGYPRFFPDPPQEDWTYGCNPFGCLARISVEEQEWMSAMFREYNDRLQEVAEANDVEFVDTHDAFDGCELTTAAACMNGLDVDPVFEWPPAAADPSSFHPNAAGHQRIAELIRRQIEDP